MKTLAKITLVCGILTIILTLKNGKEMNVYLLAAGVFGTISAAINLLPKKKSE
jgi:hypothetical protein